MLSCKNVGMKEFISVPLGLALLLAFGTPLISAAPPDAVIPEGTQISLQLNTNLSTRANSEGDAFTAVVTKPVYVGDRIIIPKGGVVNGSIARLLRPSRFKGKAVMNLSFQSIDIPGRGQVALMATLISVDPKGIGDIHSEGGIEGRTSAGSDIGSVLVPGLIGAGIGTLAGNRRGAVIGAGIGAGVGLAALFSSNGKDIEIRRGSMLVIELNRPLPIPAEEPDTAIHTR
jgi:hypothetical protein